MNHTKTKKNNKVIIVADLHFGENNNSERTGDNLLAVLDRIDFVRKEEGIDRLVIAGDYFHHRDKIDVRTLETGVLGARKLVNFRGLVGDQPDLIVGNHDLYYRHSRDCTSASVLDQYLTVHDQGPRIEGDLMLVPWVTGSEEWDQVVELFNRKKPRFVFGHFEFNKFRMNDHYVMEHGRSHRVFKSAEHVLTGHYHMRQQKDNVTYVGSPIPFNFNDANDDQRGFAILDLDTGELEFRDLHIATVRSIGHEEFLKGDSLKGDPENTSVRVNIDEDIDDETMDKIKEKLENDGFRTTKINYTPSRYKELVESVNSEEIESVENIDEAVVKYLQASDEIEGIDRDLLIDLYREVAEEQS